MQVDPTCFLSREVPSASQPLLLRKAELYAFYGIASSLVWPCVVNILKLIVIKIVLGRFRKSGHLLIQCSLKRESKRMNDLIALNKPYGVICQFSVHEKHATLKDYVDVPDFYPAGRLDTDSEGLLLLTNNGRLQAQIAEPKHKLEKTYWAQVEGVADEAKLDMLRKGVDLGDFRTRPAKVRVLAAAETAALWPRHPPIRVRQTVPDFWLEIKISEGKNRQVRRMTAKAGYPCLRLVRVAVGRLNVFELGLALGQWQFAPQRP